MPQSNKSASRLRLEIAQLAARFVAEDGINDYLVAKRKAAGHLGMQPDRNMPTNMEVEQALIEYQYLFQRDAQSRLLSDLRHKAVNAMRMVQDYDPRLTGPVLTGTATSNTEITLHLVSDEPEPVGFLLDEMGIPYRNLDKSIKISRTEKKDYPAFQFLADKTRINLVIFPERQRHFVPLSSISGKPMQRAGIDEVEKLLES